jgi:hypothetical protein
LTVPLACFLAGTAEDIGTENQHSALYPGHRNGPSDRTHGEGVNILQYIQTNVFEYLIRTLLYQKFKMQQKYHNATPGLPGYFPSVCCSNSAIFGGASGSSDRIGGAEPCASAG